jgi:D-alanyl-lipoteichoic acid acyltransferase DltB (MBOAT superfamily)
MPYLGAFAIFVTFFLVGLWHGQTTEFIFFGLLQGGGVATVQLYQQFMNQKLGKARYKELCRNALYHSASRGLTFTWFAFTLLWFWSNWTQIGDIYHKLGAPLAVAVLVSIFAVATVFLELWEGARNAILGIRMGGEPLVFSRYTRTVWNTAMAFVTISVIALLNAPAPDLVYKAF